jgi:hypothetical protein
MPCFWWPTRVALASGRPVGPCRYVFAPCLAACVWHIAIERSCSVWTRVGDLCVQPSGLCARTRARAGFVLSLTPEQENWHCLRHVLMPEPCTSVMCHVMCVCSECGPRINNERNASSQREAFRHYSFLGHTRFLLGGQLLPAPLRAAHCSPPLWTRPRFLLSRCAWASSWGLGLGCGGANLNPCSPLTAPCSNLQLMR